MSSGVYSQNGILTYIGMNFYLVSDTWSRVAGIVATSVATLILSILLPFSNNEEINENSKFHYENASMGEKLKVNFK